MMNKCRASVLILTLAATTVRGQYHCISAVSAPSKSGPKEVDIQIFGALPNGSIWTDAHQFGRENWAGLDRVSASTRQCPSVTSQGGHEASIFYINATGGNLMYKYSSGDDASGWEPKKRTAYDMGGSVSAISTLRFDQELVLVAGHSSETKSYVLNGVYENDPSTSSRWDDLGGNFISRPAVAKQPENRGIWIFGIDAESRDLRYKSVNTQSGEATGWDDLGDGPFQGSPVVTTREDGTPDLWALDSERALIHRTLKLDQRKSIQRPSNDDRAGGWEKLGGSFTDTPAVVYRGEGMFYAVGRSAADQKHYAKRFDASNWFPGQDEWLEVGGPFVSEPAILAEPIESQLLMFAIDTQDVIMFLAWHDLMDSAYLIRELGNLPPHKHAEQFSVLGSSEL